MTPQFMATITDPSGTTTEITERISDIGELSERLEEGILELVHSDIDLELDDRDGAIEAMLADATPTDEYVVRIWRQTQRRRPKWEPVFAGIPDLPRSVSVDRKSKVLSLQVFGFSKLMENASAETVRRDVSGKTGTVSASSDAVTVSPDTTDLFPRDEIRLTADDGTTETQKIKTVGSGTVTTESAWSNAFTDAVLALETPYHRNLTVAQLAGLLFDEAKIQDREILVDQSLSDIPILTVANDGGLPPESIRSLTIENNEISAVAQVSGTHSSPSPASAFVDDDNVTTAQGDWRPYQDAEPASLIRVSGDDTGQFAFDYSTGDYYELRASNTGGPPPATVNHFLHLYQNGSQIALIDSWSSTTLVGYSIRSVEVDTDNGEVWMSYSRADLSKVTTEIYGGGAYDSAAGRLRYSHQLGRMCRLNGSTLELHTVGAGKAFDQSIYTPPGLLVWTLRCFDSFFAAIFTTSPGGESKLQVWDKNTLLPVETHDLGPAPTTEAYLTVFDATDEQQLVVLVRYGTSRAYFVLSRTFAGVVPYADFDGQSCAAALRDLALISLATVSVSVDRIGLLIHRSLFPTYAEEHVVSTPFEQTSALIAEDYYTSVLVQGEDADGNEFERLGGKTWDSSRRLTLESQLISTPSHAQAIANAYAAYFSTIRNEDNVEVEEVTRIIRPMSKVTFDQVTQYRVLEATMRPREREQTLRLVQIA